MTTDRPGASPHAPWGELTYRGFSAGGAAPNAEPPPAVAARPARRQALPRLAIVGGGLAAALALGLLGGLWAKPDLGHSKTGAPMRAVTPPVDEEASATGQTMAIEVARPVPEAGVPTRSAGKLEVLPPGAAQAAASHAVPAVATAPPPPLAVADPRPAPIRAPSIQPPAVQAPTVPSPQAFNAPPAYPPRLAVPATPQPAAVATGPCANAASRAAQVVCADPDLSAADREMMRAYRRALRNGAQPEALQRDQREWLAAREDAARRSPRALAELYDRRIDELNSAADDADDAESDPGRGRSRPY